MQINPRGSAWESIVQFFQTGWHQLSTSLSPLANWVNAIAKKIFCRNQPIQIAPPIKATINLNNQTTALEQNRDQLTEQIKLLNTQINNKSDEITKQQKKQTEINDKIDEIRSEKSNTEKDVTALEATKTVTKDSANLFPDLVSKNIKNFDNQIQTKKELIKQLEIQRDELSRTLTPIQQEIAKLNFELLIFKNQLQPIVAERLEVLSKLDAIKKSN